MRSRFWLGVIFVFALASSCIDDSDYTIDSVEASPTFVLPLVSGELSIKEFIKSTDSVYVNVYPDDLVYLSYSQALVTQSIRDLFLLPDKNLTRSFFMPPVTVPPHSQDIRTDSISEVVDFGLSPEQLNEISFKSGTIDYSTSTNDPNLVNKYQISVSLPDFISKTTGKSLAISITSSGSVNLSDYVAKLNKNKFNLKMVLILNQSNTPVQVGPNTFVNLKLAFKGMDFAYMLGFFGDQTASLPADTVEIGAFGNSLNGAEVSFAQPKVSLDVLNENGVPCEVDFKKFEAQNSTGSLAVVLNPSNPITVAHPTQIGTSAKTSVSIVNAKELLDFAPTHFYYKTDARINKGLTTGNNFLADTSTLSVNLNIEIPLYGRASNINLLDTIKLNLGDVDGSSVSSAFLKAKIINELPLDARIQFYMTDEKYVILDSLFNPSQTTIIKASTVTASGDLQSPGVYDESIQLEKAKLDKIFKAKNIIIRATMNTSKDATGAQVDVKFKSKYKMKVDLGLSANFKIKAEL